MKTLTSKHTGNQTCFVVIKPGSLDLTQTIINRFAEDGWKIHMTTIKQLMLAEARELYKPHKKEPFYKDLCEYMSSSPCRAIIFKRPGEQSEKVLDEVKAIKDEIRKKYGESDMKNVLHSTDSLDRLELESRIFFSFVWNL